MDLLQACRDFPQLLDTILSCIQHPVLVTNIDGTITFASPPATTVLGFTPDELKDKNVSVIFTPEDLTHLFSNLLYLARKNEAFEGELLLVRKNKTRFFAFVRLHSCFDAKRNKAMMVISIEDIDKQKQLQKTFKGLQYEDLVRLATGIAHELRNPLVGIGGFVNRLYKECNTSDQHKTYYNYITTNLEKIEDLIRKVEFFTHLPTPCFSEESILGLVETALRPYCQQMETLGIDLSITVEDVKLRMDKDLVLKAFSMVVENALDALTEGGGFSVSSAKKDNQYEICLTDNGCGIASQDLPYIFNPFFSTKPNGAGIGLAVVKRIMESQGGSVAVKSEPGQGTTIFLQLPLERRRPLRIAHLRR